MPETSCRHCAQAGGARPGLAGMGFMVPSPGGETIMMHEVAKEPSTYGEMLRYLYSI